MPAGPLAGISPLAGILTFPPDSGTFHAIHPLKQSGSGLRGTCRRQVVLCLSAARLHKQRVVNR